MELNLTDWFNLINIVIHILGREKQYAILLNCFEKMLKLIMSL